MAAICHLCGEDVIPIEDDLKAITVCGHVFHGFCLHKWMADKQSSRTLRCPICKQSFQSDDGIQRLFFKISKNCVSSCSWESKVPVESEVEMEQKMLVLLSAFRDQEEYIKKLSDELCWWKEKADKEAAKQEEIKKENDCVTKLLDVKTKELAKTVHKCVKLREKISAINKELVVLKFTADAEIGEEHIAEVASACQGMDLEDLVDVLKKSLAICNKKYKQLQFQDELIAKEAKHTLKKYLKAKKKIENLKAKLQDSEKMDEAALGIKKRRISV